MFFCSSVQNMWELWKVANTVFVLYHLTALRQEAKGFQFQDGSSRTYWKPVNKKSDVPSFYPSVCTIATIYTEGFHVLYEEICKEALFFCSFLSQRYFIQIYLVLSWKVGCFIPGRNWLQIAALLKDLFFLLRFLPHQCAELKIQL